MAPQLHKHARHDGQKDDGFIGTWAAEHRLPIIEMPSGLGQVVMYRKKDSHEWHLGEVTQMEPIKVRTGDRHSTPSECYAVFADRGHWACPRCDAPCRKPADCMNGCRCFACGCRVRSCLPVITNEDILSLNGGVAAASAADKTTPAQLPTSQPHFEVLPVYDFSENVPVPAHRPPPLPRPKSRHGGQHVEGAGYPSRDESSPKYGETAQHVVLPSNPRAPSWCAELAEMREWEPKWKELMSELEEFGPECYEDIMTPQSLSASLREELRNEIAQIDADSETWSRSMWGGLARIRKRVSALGHNVLHATMEHLHPVARGIERDFSTFKAQQRQQYDVLAASERALLEALPVLEHRFDGWLSEPSALFKPQETAGGSSGSRSRGTSPRANSPMRAASPLRGTSPRPQTPKANFAEDSEMCELRSSLDVLEKEIELAGGTTGGWSASDHEAFIRIYRIFKSQATPVFFTKVEERLPSHSKTQIADHARWLVEHEQRQATKRRLLARWRERRSEVEREAAEQQESCVAEEAEAKKRLSAREQHQRVETKHRIAEWRQRRAEEDELEAERWRREDAKQARIEREQKKQHLQERELVEDYRRTRESRQQAQQMEEHAASRAARRALSQEDKQRIVRRNAEVLRRKLQAQGAYEGSRHGSTPRTSAREPSPSSRPMRNGYEHVHSRLYNTTESFMQKVKGEPEVEELPALAAMESKVWGGLRRAASAGPRNEFFARC